MSVARIARPGAKLLTDKVSYAFSQKDENTRGWVLRGLVDAGATGSAKFAKWNTNGDLKLIHRTEEVPRQVVSYRGDLAPLLVAKIKKALLSMHRSEAGRKVLKTFERTTQFDEIPPEQLTTLKRIARSVGEIGPQAK